MRGNYDNSRLNKENERIKKELAEIKKHLDTDEYAKLEQQLISSNSHKETLELQLHVAQRENMVLHTQNQRLKETLAVRLQDIEELTSENRELKQVIQEALDELDSLL